MEVVVVGELKATLERDEAGPLVVRFAGRSASREAAAELAPLFTRIIAVAREDGRGVVLRFEPLEYFNSSTVAALLRFVRAAQEAGLALEIVYDGRQRWQAMSFEGLRRTLRAIALPDATPGVTFRDA